ncbi:DNA-directed DNA polymerase [Gracilaria domingensis]|nr:DNA-directed DNA polymerase [Gracilaria domingensis]
MDCFFASVAVKKDPSLRGKCIAVCHGGGEISSCSYEARSYGVRAGMFAKDARKLCPQLLSVPYHFPTYEEISIQIYSLFYDYPGVYVEAVSVDEAYLDATNAVEADTSQFNPESLAENIRSRIVLQTGCTASAGIGPSKLMARLATKAAKPNGQFRVRPEKVIEYIDTLKVGDLPGVGWRTSKKMTELGVNSLPDLRNKSLTFLQTKFGDRQGQTFHELARAIDRRPVEPLKPRKSIGAEASWGIRFEQDEDEKLNKFITDMASEVACRVANAGATGSKMAVKLYRKKPNSSMVGYKFLGHGPCTMLSRMYNVPRNCGTETLIRVLRDACMRVFSETKIRNDEFRGIGLQVLDLKFADLKFDHSRTAVRGIKRIDTFFTATNRDTAIGSNRRPVPAPEPTKKAATNTGAPAVKNGDRSGTRNRRSQSNASDSEEILPDPEKNTEKRIDHQQVDSRDVEMKSSEVLAIDNAEDEIEALQTHDHDRASHMRKGEKTLTQKIPPGWDRAVFKALPPSIQAELLQSNANQTVTTRAPEKYDHVDAPIDAGRRDRKRRTSTNKRDKPLAKLSKRPRRKQKAQITMTQFADIRELRDKGNEVLDAEEFRSKPLRECIELLHDLNHGRRHSVLGGYRRRNSGKDAMKSVTFMEGERSDAVGEADTLDIPSPPSMSSDSDEEDADKIVKIMEREGIEHKQIYADEDIESFSEKLYVWMNRTACDVKSAHVELLRGRLMEYIRLKQLEHVSENVRLLRRFAEAECLKGWRPSVNALLEEVREETHRQHGLDLSLPPMFSDLNVKASLLINT